jgi:hypothetical protein
LADESEDSGDRVVEKVTGPDSPAESVSFGIWKDSRKKSPVRSMLSFSRLCSFPRSSGGLLHRHLLVRSAR